MDNAILWTLRISGYSLGIVTTLLVKGSTQNTLVAYAVGLPIMFGTYVVVVWMKEQL